MTRIFKVIMCLLFALLFSALSATPAKATTQTAASCNQSDVNAVINGPTHTAVNGDTIQIPAGSCTWTSGITVPNGIGISIIGAGEGVTIITDQLSSGSLFMMHPTLGNSTSRISSMTIAPYLPSSGYSNPVVVNGTCAAGGCPNFRIDHVAIPSSWATTGISDAAFAFISNVFGVADHNTVGDVQPSSGYLCFLNIGHGSWQGVGSWGDNSFASPDTFGTTQTFYIENNTINYALVTDTDIGGSSGGGARFACRFNTINNINPFGVCSGHGTDTTGRARGVRQWEGYYNTGTCSDSSQGCGSAWAGRGGTGMSFGNSFTNTGSGFFKGLADLNPQRRWRPDSPWGACDGSSAWDQNDGTVYYSGTISSVSGGGNPWTITDSGSPGWSTNQWVVNGTPYSFHDITQNGGFEIAANTANSLTANVSTVGSAGAIAPAAGDSYQIRRSTVCMDQPTRGAGLLVTGNTPGNPGSVAQALDPIYEAGDAVGNHADHTIRSATKSIVASRDYYAESVNQAAQTSPTSPFIGTSGTGHGTLANRPTACTTGVGYWATDQGNWNQSGSGGQGELFVCTAPNIWTLSYTPYTYPHPLVAGGTTGENVPNPPTALTATVQ